MRGLGQVVEHVHDDIELEMLEGPGATVAREGPVQSSQGQGKTRQREPAGLHSSNFKIFRRGLAPVAHFFVAHLGTLIEGAQPGFFHRRDMHEYVFAAAVGLDEPKPLDWIEPFHCTCRHVALPFEAVVAA